MALSRASRAKVLAKGASYSGLHGSFLPSSIRPDPTSGTLNPPSRVSYTLQNRVGVRVAVEVRWWWERGRGGAGGEEVGSAKKREKERERGARE